MTSGLGALIYMDVYGYYGSLYDVCLMAEKFEAVRGDSEFANLL